MLETIVLRIGIVSLTCSAVLLPLLLLTRRLHTRYAARTCYFLWLLLALRLVLPVQLTLPTPAVTVEAPAYTITLPGTSNTAPDTTPEPSPTTAGAPTESETAPGHTVSVVAVLGAVWLAGAAVCGGFYLLTYAAARRDLLSRAKPAREADLALLRSLAKKIGCHRSVRLYRSKTVHSPMMLGLVRPVILLPARTLGQEELAIILRHELTHLKRWDVAYKLLLLAAGCIHWFNPLVWWMAREAERNLELCCDDDVVRRRDKEFRRLYGEILLRTAQEPGPTPALSTRFSSGKAQMKGRLMNLFEKKRNSAWLVCLVFASAILLGSLVACESGTADLPGEQQFNTGTDTNLSTYIQKDSADPSEGTTPVYGERPLPTAAQDGPANGAPTTAGNLQYVDGERGFSLKLPEAWTGLVEIANASEDNSVLVLYQTADRKADDPTAGVLATLCVTTADDFNAFYGDKDLDGMYRAGGPRIWVLGTVGEDLIYLHVDRIPEGVTLSEDFVRLHRQLEQDPCVICAPI